MKRLITAAAFAIGFALPAIADTDTVTPTFVGGAGACYRYQGMSLTFSKPVEYAIRMPPPNTAIDPNTQIKLGAWISTIVAHPFGTITAEVTGANVSCNGRSVPEVLAPTSP